MVFWAASLAAASAAAGCPNWRGGLAGTFTPCTRDSPGAGGNAPLGPPGLLAASARGAAGLIAATAALAWAFTLADLPGSAGFFAGALLAAKTLALGAAG